MNKPLLLAAILPLLALPATAAEPVTFRADAKVTLDASGKPLSIEPSADLPQPIREFIAKRVATWSFSPPTRDGKVASGVTYLDLGACAIPVDGDGYRMALDFKGNGPEVVGGVMPTPMYPRAARIAGIETSLLVTIVVEPDGTATLETITPDEGSMPNRRDGFEQAARSWVTALHFVPEQFDGKAVRTRMRVHLDFRFSDASIQQLRKERQDQIVESNECRKAALGEQGLQPVVLDSPVQVRPAG